MDKYFANLFEFKKKTNRENAQHYTYFCLSNNIPLPLTNNRLDQASLQ